jgi:hypothetical protein
MTTATGNTPVFTKGATSTLNASASGTLSSFGGKSVAVPTKLLANCSPYNDPCHCFVLQKFSDSVQAVMLAYSSKMASPEGIFI